MKPANLCGAELTSNLGCTLVQAAPTRESKGFQSESIKMQKQKKTLTFLSQDSDCFYVRAFSDAVYPNSFFIGLFTKPDASKKPNVSFLKRVSYCVSYTTVQVYIRAHLTLVCVIIFRPHEWGRKIMISDAFFYKFCQNFTLFPLQRVEVHFTYCFPSQ